MDGAASPRPCSRKDGSESHGKNPDLPGQGGDCDLAVRTENIGIRKNWIQVCHICLVDVSSGKRLDLLEPLFLLLCNRYKDPMLQGCDDEM